ncbi:MAG: transcription elongation factor GreA [Parcubacteria group bacterium]|nr:transcription elongation factor GreA [Parcubacteria group bacterium]
MTKQEYISEEGLEKLKKELHELKTAKRQEIAQRLEEAKALGDLSENAEYMEAKETQAFNEAKIAELEELIRNAVIIEANHKKGIVDLGSEVEVKSDHGKEVFTVVGSEEADPDHGLISNESPLGKSFLGRKSGEVIEIKTPAGITKYKIISIG